MHLLDPGHALLTAYVPGGHLAQFMVARSEVHPEEQVLHEVEPLSSLLLLAMHCVHVPPFEPVCPALQLQELSVVLETGPSEYILLISLRNKIPQNTHCNCLQYWLPPRSACQHCILCKLLSRLNL